ncbi:beta-glucosidase 42 isoform X3 [Physcomitrium patens]|uniref:Beta-glucosidase n=1 Tax=Physcomitrium patens TaxID=3218 RepID=A9SRY3_PHYPA|nr:beta-glucosidase 42-like isoform X2 [Physcomitrium patens]PNR55889.1 hypothetical protein PHYPA_006786 [Physcomitrium patens]|eukprot:XP_024372566.1 beta-glucosidase 42-like isoform X2 [Physcomitrella patens]
MMGRDGLPFLIFALVALSMFLLFLQLPREELSPPRNDPTVLPCKLHNIAKHANDTTCEPFHRSLFPQNFVFGAATAAYQVEGAANESGREPSIWDTFSHTPGKVLHNHTGDVASDQFHKFLDDIDLMTQLNVDAYRFSISWSRIMKLGGSNPVVNEEGMAYYNNLINGLLKKGIQPYVTLYHWDLPQSLQDSYGGWLDRRIVNDFTQYAEACFTAFGDRVKHWITFNEPKSFTVLGFGNGIHAPGRCSDRTLCPAGNTSTEPYITAHHVLLAHAAAADVYRKKFKDTQGGMIGISVDSEWSEPLTSSVEDKEAAERHTLFQLGWFLDPIYRGDYPAIMRTHVGARLPVFTADEVALLKGSLDFIGLNHYSSRWISNGVRVENSLNSDNWNDQAIESSVTRNGTQIGDVAASEWLFIVPWGIGKTLVWLTQRYENPPLFVTENGMDDLDSDKPMAVLLNDTTRVAFYENYLFSVLEAIRNGSDVRGYFAWSLMDNFEWAMGYTRRFGMLYVDYNNNQQRHLKESAKWFSRFLSRGV